MEWNVNDCQRWMSSCSRFCFDLWTAPVLLCRKSKVQSILGVSIDSCRDSVPRYCNRIKHSIWENCNFSSNLQCHETWQVHWKASWRGCSFVLFVYSEKVFKKCSAVRKNVDDSEGAVIALKIEFMGRSMKVRWKKGNKERKIAQFSLWKRETVKTGGAAFWVKK